MKTIFLVVLLSVGLFGASAAVNSPIEITCSALVTREPNPAGIVQVNPIRYDLAKCEDVQFKGGGAAIRYVTNAQLGQWAIIFYPAHKVTKVEVVPK